MELWIRSQDNLALTKINSIGIEYDKKLVGYGNICVKLGEYKTKERALEVLDEIQNLLQPKIIYTQQDPIETYELGVYKLKQDVVMEIQEMNTFVYEMPKD